MSDRQFFEIRDESFTDGQMVSLLVSHVQAGSRTGILLHKDSLPELYRVLGEYLAEEGE